MTMVDNMKKYLSNEKGQALFEMILFIPFILFLYTIYYTAGNAINGSIVQQKAVRGYFYISLKGNSYIVNRVDLLHLKDQGMKRIGFNAFGWTDHMGGSGGKESFGTCFKFSSLLKNGSNEECDSNARDSEGSSRYVRLFTFYGVCGPNYTINTQDQLYVNPGLQAFGRESCVVSSSEN